MGYLCTVIQNPRGADGTACLRRGSPHKIKNPLEKKDCLRGLFQVSHEGNVRFPLGKHTAPGAETYVFMPRNIEGVQKFFLYHRESLENNKRVKYESVRST